MKRLKSLNWVGTERSAEFPLQKQNFGGSVQKLCKSRYQIICCLPVLLDFITLPQTFYSGFQLNVKILDSHFSCSLRRSNLKSFYRTFSDYFSELRNYFAARNRTASFQKVLDSDRKLFLDCFKEKLFRNKSFK